MTPKDAAKWQQYKQQELASVPVSGPDDDSLAWLSQIFTFAERWADLMEAEYAHGSGFADCAERTSFQANDEFDNGLTLFMYQAAVMALVSGWIHGEELRKWHNSRFSPPDWRRAPPSEGVLDCAVMSTPIGKAAIVAEYDVLRSGIALYHELRLKAGAEILMREIEKHYAENVQPTNGAYRWWIGREITQHCPNCGVHVPATTAVTSPDREGSPGPVSGDFSICVYCGAILRFDSKLNLELLTTEELRALMEQSTGEFLRMGVVWWAAQQTSCAKGKAGATAS